MLKELIKLLIGPIPDEQSIPSPREPKISVPVIDEKTGSEKENSAKMLGIILKDLEKFPPSEWKSTMYMSNIHWHEHECLKYRITFYVDKKACDIDLIFGDISLVLDDQKTLYENFYPAYLKGIVDNNNKLKEKQLSEFLDDSKRILCKDHD